MLGSLEDQTDTIVHNGVSAEDSDGMGILPGTR